VAWNKPVNKPIPLSKEDIYKLLKPIKKEHNKTNIAALLKSIALSRLKETAFDSNINIREKINIGFKVLSLILYKIL
jgi:hypothetical protein